MSYSKTHKPSEAEKRLNSLKQQLYGKDLNLKPILKQPKDESTYTYNQNLSTKVSPTLTLNHDLNFLKTDLFKILKLAILGIGIEILIYLYLRGNLIRLPF